MLDDASELVAFVEQRAGDHLRVVGEFDGIQTEFYYVRNNLAESEIRERFELIQDNITWSWSPPEDDLDEELGPKTASLQIRREAVIIHLPTGVDSGILVGLEPEAATHLTTFIGSCLEYTPDDLEESK